MVEHPVKILVGKKLRQIRHEKGLSQQMLADESDVFKSQIARIERGESNTSIVTLDKLSKALGVKIKDLVDVY